MFQRGEPQQKEDATKIQQAVSATKRTWLSRVVDLFQAEEITDTLWDELEEALISADVGVETSQQLISRTRMRVEDKFFATPKDAREILREELIQLLTPAQTSNTAGPAPQTWVVLVVGVNGSGKTTTIGKLASRYRAMNKHVLLGAADTFRAAAIDQLKLWGDRVGVEVIAHNSGADAAAVAFDAVEAARHRGADIVIIDTAGRLQTKINLMEELKKVKRVIQRVDPTAPHEVLLVLDATTGQNGLSQAVHFTEAVAVTGVVLAKLDGTAKGGIALAISSTLGLPLLYVGTGEKVEDLIPFDPAAYVDALLS